MNPNAYLPGAIEAVMYNYAKEIKFNHDDSDTQHYHDDDIYLQKPVSVEFTMRDTGDTHILEIQYGIGDAVDRWVAPL